VSRNVEPLEETPTGLPRRRLALIGVGVLCLIVAAGALFAVLRSDGGTDGGSSEDEITEITFNEADAATSLASPPPGARGAIGLGAESGTAGGKLRVQGVSFKAGKEFGPVEIYWNKVEGKPLGSAEGPRFAIDITIPSDAQVLTEGHDVIAVQRTKDGEIVNQESRRFFVVPPR
jgi:hypothetical protein